MQKKTKTKNLLFKSPASYALLGSSIFKFFIKGWQNEKFSFLLLFSTKRDFSESSPASFPTPYAFWRGSELPDWRFGERTRSPVTPLLPQPGVWSPPADSECAECSESLCQPRLGGLALGMRPCEQQACEHSDLLTDDRYILYQLSRSKRGIGIFPLPYPFPLLLEKLFILFLLPWNHVHIAKFALLV